MGDGGADEEDPIDVVDAFTAIHRPPVAGGAIAVLWALACLGGATMFPSLLFLPAFILYMAALGVTVLSTAKSTSTLTSNAFAFAARISTVTVTLVVAAVLVWQLPVLESAPEPAEVGCMYAGRGGPGCVVWQWRSHN
jgi:hypothetical protein